MCWIRDELMLNNYAKNSLLTSIADNTVIIGLIAILVIVCSVLVVVATLSSAVTAGNNTNFISEVIVNLTGKNLTGEIKVIVVAYLMRNKYL